MNPNHSSQVDYLAERERLVEVEKARKAWAESEWRLSFLRTEGGTRIPPPSDEEILQWFQQHQK
jgi:hypothetical protein